MLTPRPVTVYATSAMAASVQDSPRPQATGTAASSARNGTTTKIPITTRIVTVRRPSSSGFCGVRTASATGRSDDVTTVLLRCARRQVPACRRGPGRPWFVSMIRTPPARAPRLWRADGVRQSAGQQAADRTLPGTALPPGAALSGTPRFWTGTTTCRGSAPTRPRAAGADLRTGRNRVGIVHPQADITVTPGSGALRSVVSPLAGDGHSCREMPLRRPRRRRSGIDDARAGQLAGHHQPGHLDQPQVVPAGEVPQHLERLVDAQAGLLRQYALRLLQRDPAVQRHLQLLSEQPRLTHRPFLQEADGGHVGQRLADDQIRLVQRLRRGSEQVQGSDGLVPQPQRQGAHHLVPEAGRLLGEPRPPP